MFIFTPTCAFSFFALIPITNQLHTHLSLKWLRLHIISGRRLGRIIGKLSRSAWLVLNVSFRSQCFCSGCGCGRLCCCLCRFMKYISVLFLQRCLCRFFNYLSELFLRLAIHNILLRKLTHFFFLLPLNSKFFSFLTGRTELFKL